MNILSGTFNAFLDMFNGIIIFLLKVLGVLCAPFIVMCLAFTVYYLIKGKRFPKRKKQPTYKKESVLKRLYWDFPKRFILDKFELNPDRFPETGILIFEGEQGSGKTMSAVEYTFRLIKKYPLATFSSNFDVKGQKSTIEDLNDIMSAENGIFGQINLIDETQNWLNSNESKNVPVEFIGEICMQRKQAKLIIGTTQRFNRMAKQLRQETTFLFKPLTICGCLTVVRKYKPDVDSDGVVKKAKLLGCYFFVHTPELRNSYDTYQKIKRLSLKGFRSSAEQLGTYTPPPHN